MLVIDISVSREHIVTSIGAQRTSPMSVSSDDTVCTYKVGRVFDGKIKRPLGSVEHRYGDGAEALAEKAIAIVRNHKSTAQQEESYERLIALASEDYSNL
jgi:hypothetical protein